MKLWFGYSSEHSMNLVMIGRFKESSDAGKAKELIGWITKQVEADVAANLMDEGGQTRQFTAGMRELLTKVEIYTVSPPEMEQFAYSVDVKVESKSVVITTDESDVSAFLKILVEKGAKVEVYSAHEYQNEGYGR